MKIQRLPEEVVSRIAAGEVIERPASVVKELIENSIDAVARGVTCEVSMRGLWSIRVVDDGCGMSRDEILLALKRYATSKISRFEDLFTLRTFGFRGEALPSIGAVSRLEIRSRSREEGISGTFVRTEGGEVLEVKEVGSPFGTQVEAMDLFYNTPVRRKFLRSIRTELREVQNQVIQRALSHPEISFLLTHEGSPLLQLPSTSGLKERILSIFGREFIEGVVEVTDDSSYGYVSKPDNLRLSRTHQFLFVNNRPVQSRNLSHAVYLGYGENLGKGRHPAYILFLRVNPSTVDVNVHPAKREVRFQDERGVQDTIRRSVKRAVRPSEALVLKEGVQDRVESWGEEQPQMLFRERESEIYTASKEELPPSRYGTPSLPFWQLHRVYIFAQTQSGTIIVDQHNAHERVIFDDIMKMAKRKERGAQNLLFPIVMDLTPKEWEVLDEHFETIEEIGFVLKRLSGRTLVIEGIPLLSMDLKSASSFGPEEMRNLLDELSSQEGLSGPRLAHFETVARSFACKSAIKKGEALSLEEMSNLLDRLFATENPYLCPHGRPIIVRMTLEELDRKFGRI